MGNGQQSTYDLSSVAQDPGFVNASAQDKIAYLSAHDADFAKASPKDKAGYLNHILGYDQPSSIEQAGATPGRLEAGNEVAGKILGGAGLPTSISDIPKWGSRLLGQTPDSKPLWQPFVDAYNAPTQRNIVNAVPFLGPTAVAAADEPTLLGKAATLTGTALGGASAPEVKPGLKAVKAETVDATRTPANALKPGVREISRVAGGGVGAVAGAATGIPGAGYGGGVGGAILGPTIANKVLPFRSPSPNFYEGAYAPPEVYPGATLPSADEFYANRGKEMNAIRRMQKQPIPPTPEPELGSPENPGFYAKLPTRMPKPATTTASETTGPKIITPSSSGEPRFAGSEGRPATWTNEAVMREAAHGNRDAIQQAIRRGMQLPENARYVMGDPDFSRTVYNPKESTTFTPGGVPIRNKSNPSFQNPSAKGNIVLAGSPYAPPGETPEVGSPYSPPQSGSSDAARSLTGGNSGPYAPVEPHEPMNPQEVIDMSVQLGRNITAEQAPDIRRRLEAERNVETGLAGNRTDTAGNIREAHREKLEKKGRR